MKRKTIEKEVSLSGIGLHSGKTCKITIKPTDKTSGIFFNVRNGDGSTVIKADIGNVVDTVRCTTIGKKDSRLRTVEHLLSATYALGIDDLEIDCEGPELPIMDGSASPFVEALQSAGIKETDEKEKEYFLINEILRFWHEESGAEYIVIPDEEFSVQVNLNYESPMRFFQSAILKDLNQYQSEIAPNKTFVFTSELEHLKKNQLIQGGSVENALVINDGILSQTAIENLSHSFGIKEKGTIADYDPRSNNSLAKHKLLDLLGDLALLGKPIKAKIIASQPGHGANVAFTHFLKERFMEQRKLKGKPVYDPTIPPLYDNEAIQRLIPHRYPFLLVDKIIEVTENRVVGIKNVTRNEAFFQGHFPGNPVFPGVLQLEALAQTGGILVLSQVEDPENYNTYFMKIDNVKFKQLVVPGDTMILKMELLSPIRRGIVHMQGTVYVGNKIASESELVAQISKKNSGK